MKLKIFCDLEGVLVDNIYSWKAINTKHDILDKYLRSVSYKNLFEDVEFNIFSYALSSIAKQNIDPALGYSYIRVWTELDSVLKDTHGLIHENKIIPIEDMMVSSNIALTGNGTYPFTGIFESVSKNKNAKVEYKAFYRKDRTLIDWIITHDLDKEDCVIILLDDNVVSYDIEIGKALVKIVRIESEL